MKTIFKLMLCMFLVGVVVACSDDTPEENNNTIAVTPGTLDGNWQLTEWSGELSEGMYVYITFERKERTFVMYDNMGSMYAKKSTGTFNVFQDEELGTILTGEYDHDNGSWGEYVVLFMDGSILKLARKEDRSDVSVYTRCAKIPEDIQNGSRMLSLNK